jgi:hypothetical protein
LLLNSYFESAEVGVFDVNILADALDQQFACGEMDFTDGRHPQSLAEARLFKNERRTFVDARQESAADVEVVVKPRFETGDIAVRFVDPNGTGNLPGGPFGQAVGFEVGISDEIKRQSAPAVE